ncbi:MAG: PEP-utilizing enzyme [Anaerolineales bacterium]|jgi:pyruvate,water dikinase
MSDQNHQMQIKPGQPIPSPDNFPVTWENPDDQDLLWTFDRYHYPSPLAPLEYELIDAIYENGAREALSKIDVPFQMINQRINTYFYRASIPKGAPPDGVIRMLNTVRRFAPGVVKAIESKAVAAMTNTYLPKLYPLIDDLDASWNQNYLPVIKAFLAEWESFDLVNVPWNELLAHLDKVLSQAERIGEIHFLIFGPYIFAMSEFEEYFSDLFRTDGDNFAAYRLLQGFDNMILVGDRALWDLGRKALTMPAVQRILEEKKAKDVIPALEGSATGQVFLEEFNAFLREHGQRGAMYSAIGEVSWIEDPTPVIKMLKDYITQPDRDLLAELAAESAERERHVKEARTRLKGYPQPVIDEFERLLKAAQIGTVLHSDHGYWIDYRAMYGVRRVLLALGRRLSRAGVIDQAADVLFLWSDELKAAARDSNQANLKDVVAERKAEMAHFATIKPPAMLGTMPLMSPPTDEPLFRTMAKTSGDLMISSMDGKPGVLHGNAGSPGIARGPAKVVRSLKEAGKLQPGDILVAETTAPPWTPLFATAIAIVTDAGGILSHCAVVAREYHIPAVVGTVQATTTIQDGQLIEVNGDNGEVRILEPV